MNDYQKVETIKELIEKKASPADIKTNIFVNKDIEKKAFAGAVAGALGKGALGAGKAVLSNPGTALTVGFSGLEAGSAGMSAARKASSTVVGVPPPGNM